MDEFNSLPSQNLTHNTTCKDNNCFEVDSNQDSEVRSSVIKQQKNNESIKSEIKWPKVCRDGNQFKAWQRSRPWLRMHADTGGVSCDNCSKVKSIGIHAERGQHLEDAFVEGTVSGKNAKVLLKKIDKHKTSKWHMACGKDIGSKS